MTAHDAQPGDILLDSAGTAWQRGTEPYFWATFTGPVGFYGPWMDSCRLLSHLTTSSRP